MKTILSIFGTRPEAIKFAPVIRELEKHEGLNGLVAVTAQHREMLDQVLDSFSIKADFDLDIMTSGQSLAYVASEALRGIERILRETAPDIVLVQGDTITTFAASLAAYYQRIPVGHIEAGLRTNDKYQPFPEEINRVLASRIADLHFAPTPKAQRNLLEEGIEPSTVFLTGNTIVDSVLLIKDEIEKNEFFPELPSEFFDEGRKLVMVTAHRRENFGMKMRNICRALLKLAELHSETIFLFPVHPNPEVGETVRSMIGGVPNIHLVSPLDYRSFVYAMDKAHLILTDSGGVQEEAPSLGKPVLVMRNVSERPEGVEAGVAKLIGTNEGNIVSAVDQLLSDPREYRKMKRKMNLYGDAGASGRIVSIVCDMLL